VSVRHRRHAGACERQAVSFSVRGSEPPLPGEPSTGLLLLWLLVVLGFDHLNFWRIRPGQVTHEYVLGTVESSYDTDNMVFTKQQADLFRNWNLGLGSGDLRMQTMGGRGVVAEVSNVLFLNVRMAQIQSLSATKPDVPQKA
jgi:hypothetical protein